MIVRLSTSLGTKRISLGRQRILIFFFNCIIKILLLLCFIDNPSSTLADLKNAVFSTTQIPVNLQFICNDTKGENVLSPDDKMLHVIILK